MAGSDLDGETFWKSFMGPFEPLLKLGLGAVVKWVVLQGPIVLRCLAGAFLLAFLISSAWFWYGFSGMQDTFLQGIGAELDDPNQNYPGLEAILLSTFGTGVPKSLAGLEVSDVFVK